MRKRPRKRPPPSSPSPPSLCCHLCSLLSCSWIALLLLNSILIRTIGIHGVSSNSLPWSVPWLKGVRAERNENEEHPVSSSSLWASDRHDGVDRITATKEGEIDTQIEIDAPPADLTAQIAICHASEFGRSYEKRSFNHRSLSPRHSKCSSSVHDFFLQLVFPVCSRIRSHVTPRLIQEVTNKDRQSERDGGVAPRPLDESSEAFKPPAQEDLDGAERSEAPKSSSENNVNNSNVVGRLISDVKNESRPVLSSNLSKVHVRQEPGDGPYNYASDSKGAKVLASNKEAKGASNILNKDKDKYLRTPCSVENKYVDIELAEETLVVTVVIANHEFYSSNVRELELWGSLDYPTEEWTFLGKFEAENNRVPHTFTLSEPKWVRYLRIRMVNHYGSDFYCTLSVLEVYGVDAIEWLLEDWIAEAAGAGVKVSPAAAPSQEESIVAGEKVGPLAQLSIQVPDKDMHLESPMPTMRVEDLPEAKGRSEIYNVRDGGQSVHHQSSRPALDAVMKLLMQKVRTLEHNQPVISQYYGELNDRYREVLKSFDKELVLMTGKLNDAMTEIANLTAWLHIMEHKWKKEKYDLEKDLSHQVKAWAADMEFLRNRLKTVENKEIVALTVALLSILLVVAMQFLIICMSFFNMFMVSKAWLSTHIKALWAVPFLGCGIVVFVLSM